MFASPSPRGLDIDKPQTRPARTPPELRTSWRCRPSRRPVQSAGGRALTTR